MSTEYFKNAGYGSYFIRDKLFEDAARDFGVVSRLANFSEFRDQRRGASRVQVKLAGAVDMRLVVDCELGD
jgi:hypothetical protein